MKNTKLSRSVLKTQATDLGNKITDGNHFMYLVIDA